MTELQTKGLTLLPQTLTQDATGISDIQITASPGQVIAPPPEGASYLGFIFAQGMSPHAVESSLRQAHQRLVFEIQADIPVNQARA